jgi:hypothetical protein
MASLWNLDWIYYFDADVTNILTKYIPRDVFVSLWDYIDTLVDMERLWVPKHVADECDTDWASMEWLGRSPHVIKPFDEVIGDCMSRIMKENPAFIHPAKLGVDADPFLVASAMAENMKQHEGSITGSAVVVTLERCKKEKETRLRIPDVCASYKIECTDLSGFFRRENLKY